MASKEISSHWKKKKKNIKTVTLYSSKNPCRNQEIMLFEVVGIDSVIVKLWGEIIKANKFLEGMDDSPLTRIYIFGVGYCLFQNCLESDSTLQ